MRELFCNKPDVRTRGCLTFSQTIYMVIHYYVCHVYITFESMNGMTHTDSPKASPSPENAITSRSWLAKFNTLRIRKRTAMSCMCTISVEIATDTARTTDTGITANFSGGIFFATTASVIAAWNPYNGTAWTPVRTNIISVIF